MGCCHGYTHIHHESSLSIARSHVHGIDTQLSHRLQVLQHLLDHLLSRLHWLANHFFFYDTAWLSSRNRFGIILFRSIACLNVEFSCKLLFLVRGDAHVAVTTNCNLTILARFYNSTVSAISVEEGIQMSMKEISGDAFLVYQNPRILFTVMKTELIQVDI